MSDVLKKIFGVPDMPPVSGFKPVRDDYSAGFANGVEAVRDWLRSVPKIEMPTRNPDVVSIHDMSALEAAAHLDDIIETMKDH